jgi:sugar O-acyltransferase (sialic acid O-acetyltransferase NeuD family)
MSKLGLLLIGAGGHAKSCVDVIEQENEFQIIGLVGSLNEVGTQVLGYEVLGTDDDLPELMKFAHFALISVGQIGVNELRSSLFSKILNFGFTTPVITSPLAYVSPHAVVGKGTVVMHHATINAGVSIGSNCIINSQVLVEHDVVVEDHCHIATGATINGGSRVGRSSFVGSGSKIRESINIGTMCAIGMGVIVRHDVPANSQFVGDLL